MANSPQARKRMRQAEKKRKHNIQRKREMRTYVKKVRKFLLAKDIEGAKNTYPKASSMLDKLAQKNIIHKNTASRIKSRLSAAIKKADLAAA